MKHTAQSVTSNFLWRFMERIGAQGVSLIVSIVLARILDPDVYGTIALVTVITSILEVFITSGVAASLIQKKDADDLDFSSIFYFNVACSLVLYLLMFVFAPAISEFYKRPELKSIIRVLSLTVVIGGVKNVQHAYVAKNMLFKRFFYATLGGTIGAAVIGIYLAYRGYGAWALVAQTLFNHTLDTIILWLTVKWRPIWGFSMKRLKNLYAYGWKILASSLISKGCDELRTLIIGKKYTASDLAFYNRGSQFPKLFVYNINSSIDSILLPTLSSEQDNVLRVRNMMRRAIKTSSYLIMPCMVGLAVCAESIVSILLTDKWLPSVFYMRIFCFTFAFYPIHTTNLNAIKAMGRSDIFLKLQILKNSIGIIALLSTVFISVKAMALSLIVTSVLNQLINAYPNKKLLKYRYVDQLKDMLPAIGLSCIMGIFVYGVNLLQLNQWMTILIQIPLGMIIYLAGSKLLKIDSFDFVIKTALSFVKRNKQKINK